MYDYLPKPRVDKVGDIFSYRVEKGDTVYQIARQFNTDVEWIKVLNQLNQEALIFEGQLLLVPVVYPMPRDYSRSYDLYF